MIIALACPFNKNILRLNIPMDNVPVMQVSQCLQQLPGKVPKFNLCQRKVPPEVIEQRQLPAKLEHKRYLSERLNCLIEPDKSTMLKILHDSDLLAYVLELGRVGVHLELLVDLDGDELLGRGVLGWGVG